MLLFTDPRHFPVPLLVLPLGLLFAALYTSLKTSMTKFTTYKESRVNRLSAGGASILIIAVALQSLGQLTARDIIVSSVLVVIGFFYLGRTMDRR